ncbi:MAG: hypothetical protein R3E79_53680 [Caldilineaceae bacterium]
MNWLLREWTLLPDAAGSLGSAARLGFVMGAIKRWGHEPTAVVPTLAPIYAYWLRKQTVARDDVFTLTVANPTMRDAYLHRRAFGTGLYRGRGP